MLPTTPFEYLRTSEVVREIQLVEGSAVYFLFQDEQIAYVGQTRDVAGVVSRHRKGRKRFNRVFFVHVPPEKLDEVEQACIVFFRPPLNRATFTSKIPLDDARRIVKQLLGHP